MRSVHTPSHIIPFPSRATYQHRTAVGPLPRIELHQVEHDEISQLRARLRELILDREQTRKINRLRLVN